MAKNKEDVADSLNKDDAEKVFQILKNSYSKPVRDGRKQFEEELDIKEDGYESVFAVSKEGGLEGKISGLTYGNLIKVTPDEGEEFYIGAIGYHTGKKGGKYAKQHKSKGLKKFEEGIRKKSGEKAEGEKVKMFIVEATPEEKESLKKQGYEVVTEEYHQPSIRVRENGSPIYKPVKLSLMVKYVVPLEEKHLMAAVDQIWDHWYTTGVKDGSKEYKNVRDKIHKPMLEQLKKQIYQKAA